MGGMAEKTVLFYINTICRGGAERAIIQLAYHFALAGYRSVLVTSFANDNEYPIPKNIKRISIEQEEIKQSRFMKNFSRIKELRRICKNENASVIISFLVEPNIRAIIATRGLPVKCIISVRNVPNQEYKGELRHFCARFLLPLADGCVFQTEAAKKWFPKRLQKKAKVIFNVVDKTFFNTEYIGGKNIVALGRLSEQKNHRILIRSFSKIAYKYPDWKLCIYGTGLMKKVLIGEIDRLNMSDHILLMGQTTNAQRVLSEAGIFVLSSDFEGMPNALMEALAVGVPCISTDCPCGGPRMLIQDGLNGILVPVGNEEELTHALERLLKDKEFSIFLSKEAKKRAMDFISDKVFGDWEKYIEDILK